MPQIQEPDDRFWTPLRVAFVLLLLAGAIHLATHPRGPATPTHPPAPAGAVRPETP